MPRRDPEALKRHAKRGNPYVSGRIEGMHGKRENSLRALDIRRRIRTLCTRCASLVDPAVAVREAGRAGRKTSARGRVCHSRWLICVSTTPHDDVGRDVERSSRRCGEMSSSERGTRPARRRPLMNLAITHRLPWQSSGSGGLND